MSEEGVERDSSRICGAMLLLHRHKLFDRAESTSAWREACSKSMIEHFDSWICFDTTKSNTGANMVAVSLLCVWKSHKKVGGNERANVVCDGPRTSQIVGNVACKSLGAPKNLPFVAGRTDDTSGAAWECLAYMNADPPQSIEQLEDRVALRGLSKQGYVALAFPYFPTVAALQSMMEANGGDDENVWIRTLNPDFQRQVEHYVAAGDDVYKKDFGFAWTKLMTSDMFDGPIHRTGMKE